MKIYIPTFENYNSMLFELSENSTLYHRSTKKLKEGDIIKPKKIKGSHWLENQPMEIVLEYLRKTEYPDRPSRFECIYTSAHPRSRFLDKGDLYVVKPIGNLFMTDSTLIDNIGEEFSNWLHRFDNYGSDHEKARLIKGAKDGDERSIQQLIYGLPYEAHIYWKGTQRGNIKDLEILSDSAVITEVPQEETKRLKIGQNIKVIESGVVATMTLYFNSRHDTGKVFTEDEVLELVNQIKNEIYEPDVKIEDKEYARKEKGRGKDGSDEMVFGFNGTLRPGAKLKITHVKSGIAYNTTRRDWEETPKKYTNISFDFYIKRKLFKRKDNSPSFSFDTYDFLNENIWDISKFFAW